MALTINQSPYLIHSIYNPQYYTITSGLVGNPGFSLLTKLSTLDGTILTTRQYPLTNSYCAFDTHRVMENKLSYDFQPNCVDFTPTYNSLKEYKCECTESISTSTYYLSGSDDRKYALNSYHMTDSEFSDKFQLNDPDNEFLTNYSGSRFARITDDMTFSILNGKFNSTVHGHAEWLRIEKYPFGNQMTTYYISSSCFPNDTSTNDKVLDAAVTQSNLRLDIGVGPNNIRETSLTYYNVVSGSGSYFTVGGDNVILEDSVAYRVCTQLPNFNGKLTSIWYNIYLQDSCDNDLVYRLAWLNKYGAFEYYNFTCTNRKSHQIERNQYKKMPYAFDVNNYYVKTDKSFYNTTIENKFTNRYTLNTDWMTENEAKLLLNELFISPIVFMLLDNNSDWHSAQLLNTEYPYKTNKDGLIQYTVELELSELNYTQRA